MYKQNIINKIQDGSAVVGIIGLGYVGLPLVIRFSEEGFKVIGFDIDENKCKALNSGESYIKHISASSINKSLENGFEATSDWEKIGEVDCFLICVPTPLAEDNVPDLQYIISTLTAAKSFIRQGQLMVLESTTYPGTTEEELVPVVTQAGLKPGDDFFIGYSPERENPGSLDFSTQTIPKVVSGITGDCLEVTDALYNRIVDRTVPVSSPKVAEMTKLLENIHRAVNIGLVNELKIAADKMGIDIFEVIKAASTKPFGFTPYFPGPGLGGHCIPIDPFYLTWKAKQMGVDTKFIELAGEVNTNIPNWVISKSVNALKSAEKSVENSRILLLGLAYKKNVDDMRESPSLELMDKFTKLGAQVDYHDFYIPTLTPTRKYSFQKSSVNLDNIADFDLVLLATDHDAYDYESLVAQSQIIVDTRGRLNRSSPNVVAA